LVPPGFMVVDHAFFCVDCAIRAKAERR
jgi:hypothetical protein